MRKRKRDVIKRGKERGRWLWRRRGRKGRKGGKEKEREMIRKKERER